MIENTLTKVKRFDPLFRKAIYEKKIQLALTKYNFAVLRI